MQQVIAILGEDGSDIKVEVTGEDNLPDLFPISASGETVLNYKQDDLEAFHIDVETEDGSSHTITLPSINPDDLLGTNLSPIKTNRTREDSISGVLNSEGNNDAIQIFQPNDTDNLQTAFQDPLTAIQIQHANESVQTAIPWTAESWLASVTEMINHCMNYNYPGQPDPLVLMIPQHFFDFLMERISAGSKKKRLPNSTISIVRHQPPRGKFTKYTWLLTNVLHVKQVFDTSLVLLEVSRKFSKSEDGTYQYEKQSIDQLRTLSNGGLLPKKPKIGKLIKPLEWKTFVSPIIENICIAYCTSDG